MIRAFLQERLSWIAFCLFAHLFVAAVAALDASIPLRPVLYIVFLSLILFVIFLVVRFNKETRFYKHLAAWDNDPDLLRAAHAATPFERMAKSAIEQYTERLSTAAAHGAHALEQEQDELLAWIHEVKTPLTAMRLMIDRVEDDAVRASLTYEWLRIHLLLDQQLHRKRLASIESDLHIERVNLEALIVGEIRTMQSWCIQKGIGFDLQLETPYALSDAKWLAFILRQLLTNAVKYSPDGAQDIAVLSYEQQGRTMIEVRDFGIGIDPKDVPRLFEAGFTSSVRRADQGATGMGLYLARKAAETLHINIAVHSEPGAGSTFTLAFPRENSITRMTSV